MVNIKGILENEHYTTRLFSSTQEILADEPLSKGGKEKGFSPEELLTAALAACTSITLRMYADRKGWPLEKVEVHIRMEKDTAASITHIIREIQLTGELPPAQRERLLEIANQCPVHKILSNPIFIKSALV